MAYSGCDARTLCVPYPGCVGRRRSRTLGGVVCPQQVESDEAIRLAERRGSERRGNAALRGCVSARSKCPSVGTCFVTLGLARQYLDARITIICLACCARCQLKSDMMTPVISVCFQGSNTETCVNNVGSTPVKMNVVILELSPCACSAVCYRSMRRSALSYVLNP